MITPPADCAQHRRYKSFLVLFFRKEHASLLFCLLAGACSTPAQPVVSQYRSAVSVPPLSLAFARGTADLTPGARASLQALARSIPAWSEPEFYGTGMLVEARAASVAHVLQRPVQAERMADGDPDVALLSVPVARGILADACHGMGGTIPDGMWPADDGKATRTLPPGCSTEADMEAQIARPFDLLQGRRLVPGAAMPFAAAIERYYHRNDLPGVTPASAGSAGATGQTSQPPANPLLGGLAPQSSPGQLQ
jgi:hypothetical protein